MKLGYQITSAVTASLRDRFWRAFWRRQQKYLPPAANITISNVHAHVDRDATVPAFNVEVGREWVREGERAGDQNGQ